MGEIMKHFLVLIYSIAVIVVLVFGYFQYNQKLTKAAEIALSKQIIADKKEEQRLEQELLLNPWKDLNWYAIGDSITDFQKYQVIVKDGLMLNHVTTDAKPGQQIGTMVENITKEKLMSVDLITVFGGTNDYGGNKPLGDVNDSKDTDTFYGNLKNVIETINSNKTEKATVVFFTPLKRGEVENQPTYPYKNGAGHKLEDYVEAIKVICDSYSIPVIDLFNKSGIDTSNLKQYTGDNLHPNDEGFQLISKVMVDEIKTIKPTR